MCNRVTWISDEKVTELFEELADLRGRVNTEYQRGREDAAQQVHTELLAQFRGVEHAGHRAVVAAARGDGEQA